MSEELKEFQAAYESGDYTEYYSYLLDYAEAQFNKAQELSDLLTQISYDKAIHESNMHKILKLEEQNKRYREALEFYADKGTYEVVETLPPTDEYHQPIEPVFKTVPIIYYDKGREARKALEESE